MAMNQEQLQELLTTVQRGQGKRLPPFTSAKGSDWIPWKNMFRALSQARNWGDVVARNHLATAMEGEANNRVAHINPFVNNPATHAAWTMQELLDAYDAVFLPEAGGHLARAMFKQARQKQNEDIVDFHSRLRALFSRSDPQANAEASRDLREQFINGLGDPTIRDRTMNDFPDNYTDALACATKRAAALAILRSKQSTVYDADTINNLHAGGEEGAEGGSGGRCFNCNEYGHRWRACPKPLKDQLQKSRRGGRGNFRRGGGRGGGRRNFDKRAGGSKGSINALADTLQELGLKPTVDTTAGGSQGEQDNQGN